MLRIISSHKTEGLKRFDWMNAIRMASNAMKIALEAENYTGASQTAVLDELDDTLTQMSNSKRIKWSNPTTKLDFAAYEKPADFLRYKLDQTLTGFSDSGRTHWSNSTAPLGGFACKRPISFLTYAIQCGLTLYVKSKLHFSDVGKKDFGARSPLDYATWCQPNSVQLNRTASSAMVMMLFDMGYGPNDHISDQPTPWLSLLGFFNDMIDATGQASPRVQGFDLLWVHICKLFLMAGADVNVSIQGRSVWYILRICFAHLPSESVIELNKLIGQAKTRSRNSDSIGHVHQQDRKQGLGCDEGNEPKRGIRRGSGRGFSHDSRRAIPRYDRLERGGNNREDYHRRDTRPEQYDGKSMRNQSGIPARRVFKRPPNENGHSYRSGRYRSTHSSWQNRHRHNDGWRPY